VPTGSSSPALNFVIKNTSCVMREVFKFGKILGDEGYELKIPRCGFAPAKRGFSFASPMARKKTNRKFVIFLGGG